MMHPNPDDLGLQINRRTFLRRSGAGPRRGRPRLAARPAPARRDGSAPARAGVRSIRCTIARQGEAGHLADDGRRARRTWRRSTTSPSWPKMHGKPMPESMTKGQQLAQLQGQKLVCFGPQTKFQRFGKCGAEICELFPQPRLGRRRPLHRPVDDDRRDQPRSGPHVHEHGSQIAGRPSMGAWVTLRPGERGGGPARLRGPHLARAGRPEPADRRPAVVGGLPAEQVPGRPPARQGRPGAVPEQPAGRLPRRSSGTWSTPSTRINARVPTPLVDDPEIATRIAQYEMAFRMQASVPDLMDTERRAARGLRPLRLQAGRRLVRLELPAGPPAGRARRALHPALPQGLGPPRRRQGGHRAQGRGDRPGLRGPDHAT